jgi:tRNA-specific 2-thiouridylase
MRDVGGATRGRHAGLPFYTVGQRHGLGLGNPRPLYVVALEPETNEVIVGEDRDLWTREIQVEAVNLIAVDRLSAPTRVLARIRYAHEPQAATAAPLSAERLRLTFDAPQRAVAPGQAAVFYDAADPELLLGGGTICRPGWGTDASGERAGSTRSPHE